MMELVVTPSLCSDWLVPEWIDRKMIEPRPWNPLLHSYVAALGVGLGGVRVHPRGHMCCKMCTPRIH